MCDRIAVLNFGKKIAEGTMDQLRSMSGMQGRSLEDIFLAITHDGPIPPPVISSEDPLPVAVGIPENPTLGEE